jgi:hypothetical protein
MSLFYKVEPIRAFQFNHSLTENSSLKDAAIIQRARLIEELAGSARFDVSVARDVDNIVAALFVTQLQTRLGKAMVSIDLVLHDSDWLVEDPRPTGYTIMTDSEFRKIAATSFQMLSEDSNNSPNANLIQSFQFTEENHNIDLVQSIRESLPTLDLIGVNLHFKKIEGRNGETERVVNILSGLDESGSYPKSRFSWTLRYGDRLTKDYLMPGGYTVAPREDF